MPFSRYQIRNEFSLADPELYKAADKDDPEALLEGVAMAGLVGVLRQLGDLAEFAAEIFHGLHEEVMVTAARGHGLLERVQQLEADFPSIERAFLSQTGHSAFFSSSGIGWHPNLKTEQNLITRGDLPRFVMDSYEECRGPPRLFLLDKFDVNGAGACLKRYTDPSFYKVEASSYEMSNAEAQRNKKIRKTKKKGSRLKNGETPEVFQPSHVKLHQLLLEERVQNGASEVTTRRVNLKKREIKFPFDTESGKGYMEKLLSSPPQDKLVHEVPSIRYAPTVTSGAPPDETLEITMINESPNEPELIEEEEEVEEKHVSNDHKSDGYESDDVVSEVENYVDALATMESEIETDAELRPNSDDPSVKQETDSNSGSASDNGSSSNHKKITSFSYSDSTSDNVSPRGIDIDPPPAFAITEIPFRPRVQDTVFEEKENTLKESELSEVSSTKRTEDIELDPEDIIAHSSTIEDHNSNSTLVEDHPVVHSLDEVDICDEDMNPSLSKEELTDDFAESKKSDLAKPVVLYSSGEDEKELKEKDDETELNELTRGYNNLPNFEDEKETESVNSETNKDDFVPDMNERKDVSSDEDRQLESVNSKAKDVLVPDMTESEDLSGQEDGELEGRETEIVNSEAKDDFVPAMDDSKDEERETECINLGTRDDFVPDINESKGVSTHEGVELEGREMESFISEGKDVFVPDMNESKDVLTHEERELEGREMESVNPEGKDVFAPDMNESKDELSSEEYREYEGREAESVNSEGKDVFVPESKDVSSNEDRELEGRETEAVNSESKDTFVPDMNEARENVDDNTSASLKEQISQEESDNVMEKTVENEVQIDENPDETAELSNRNEIKKLEEEEVEEEKVEQPHIEESLQKENEDSIDNYHSEEVVEFKDGVKFSTSEFGSLPVSEEASTMLPQVQQYPLPPELNLLPQVNLEEMPPLPPLPPMQWRMGKLPNSSLLPLSKPDDNQHGFNIFPPAFPPSLHTNLTQSNDYQETPLSLIPTDSTLHTENEEAAKSEISTQVLLTKSSLHTQEEEVKAVKTETSSQVLPTDSILDTEKGEEDEEKEKEIEVKPKSENENVGVEIIRPLTTSSLPLVDEDNERPNGIRPMKIQRPRTPLIDAVAAHDITKLRKVSERPMPPTPKEEERDTLLEQIRAKSLKLKPAVQTRPSIQGPSTNLRVAAILEKANAIRQAFAGSDDDDDDEDDDSWSDS